MSQVPITAPESIAPLEPPDAPLLEPESLLDVELSLERPESSPEPELPLDPELPEPTLESRPPAAPLEPELPPELGAPPEAEDAPPPEPEDELVVSPEPHAQKDAATTETAKGASARVEVFRRTRGQRAVCTIHVAVASECASVNENRRGVGRQTLRARRTARSPGPT
jgi:fused signal recognition particle receptor